MVSNKRHPISPPDIRQKLNKFGLPGTFRFTIDLPSAKHKLRRVLPFNRSWKVILVIAAIDVALMIPAMVTFGDALENWQKLDSLFDLTSAIFLTAWVVGWSMAPLIISLILLLAIMGREVLIGRPGALRLGIGLPGFILCTDFDVRKIENLRLSDPEGQSGTGWRGTHISFDYGDRPVHFGSSMTQRDLSAITQEIEMATHGVAQRVDARAQSNGYKFDQESLSQSPTAHGDDVSTSASITSLSTLVLIASNLVPVIGALYFGWRLGDIMVLYWAESAVVALYNVAKIAFISKWAAVFSGTFFLAHFSAFMAIHFLFIYGLFIEGVNQTTDGNLKEVAELFISLWPALLALVISHGVSFVTNYVGKKEYKRVTLKQQMAAPYSRVVLMHLTLIFGGFITLMLGDPQPVLLLFILIKIIFDVKAHLKEHKYKK